MQAADHADQADELDGRFGRPVLGLGRLHHRPVGPAHLRHPRARRRHRRPDRPALGDGPARGRRPALHPPRMAPAERRRAGRPDPPLRLHHPIGPARALQPLQLVLLRQQQLAIGFAHCCPVGFGLACRPGALSLALVAALQPVALGLARTPRSRYHPKSCVRVRVCRVRVRVCRVSCVVCRVCGVCVCFLLMCVRCIVW